MEELCQPSLNGRGGPIASISIQATNFGLKNDMIQQVQTSCQFHGLPGDDANKHLDKFLHVTQSIKVNGVTDDALRLYLFPHSLTHHATAWFDLLLTNKSKKLLLILKLVVVLIPTMIFQPPLAKPRTYMLREPIEMNTASSSGLGTLPSNTVTNPNEDLKGITTRSGTAYQGSTIPTTSSSLPKVVERETEVTKDTVHPTKNGSTKDVQPLVIQIETPMLNSEPVVTPIIEPVVAPVSALKPNQKPLIPYSSRLHDQKLRDKTNDQKDKFFKIFQDLNFNISFADALILMPKFCPTIKTLLTNKDKLYELARTPLNEHCSAVLLKKFPKKLGDPGKFLIPCDFSRMDEYLALADLDASINLMTLSVWNILSLPELALIDVFEGELTLRVVNEAITFNLDQTSRYSANYNYMTTNGIDVIDMACEEYSQEVLDFFDVIASGN
nr:reverse transcriptase domain-containing protein [Tanacetum cinerariifolium]